MNQTWNLLLLNFGMALLMIAGVFGFLKWYFIRMCSQLTRDLATKMVAEALKDNMRFDHLEGRLTRVERYQRSILAEMDVLDSVYRRVKRDDQEEHAGPGEIDG